MNKAHELGKLFYLCIAVLVAVSCTPSSVAVSKIYGSEEFRRSMGTIEFNHVAHRGGRWVPSTQRIDDPVLRPVIAATGLLIVIDGAGKQHKCTGFLIDTDRVMTAMHCLSGSEVVKPIAHIGVLFGAIEGSAQPEMVSFDTRPSFVGRDIDIAIIRTKNDPNNMRRPGLEYGYLSLANELILPSEKMFAVHFPGGKKSVVSEDKCTATNVNKDVVIHSCDTIYGSSGAPIVNTSGEVVAVHSGGTLAHNKGYLPRSLRSESFILHDEAYVPAVYGNLILQTAREEYLRRLQSGRDRTDGGLTDSDGTGSSDAGSDGPGFGPSN